MSSWCCAYTHEYCELKAERSLKEKGLQVFNPHFIEERVARNKVAQKRLPLFPQYVFVLLDLATPYWRRASYAKGVAYLLGAASETGRPSTVRTGLLEDLI